MAVAVGELRRRQEAMEFLVGEISRGDDDNVPASIQIAIERGWATGIVETMLTAKARKETEIDRICYRHYGDFLASVKEIVHMRDSAAELTKVVGQLHEDFCGTGQELVHILSELDAVNSEREGIRRALEVSEKCRDIAKLMVEARQQIASDDHYSAVHTIERIQADSSYINVQSLSQILKTWLPRAVDQILQGAQTDADKFLSEARAGSSRIGTILLRRQINASLPMHGKSFRDGLNYSDNISISLHYIRRFGTIFQLEKWAQSGDFENIIPHIYKIDEPQESSILNNFFEEMGPLHKALYTCTVLGQEDSFHAHCRSVRETELFAIVDGAGKAAAKHGLIQIFPNLTASIVGFFAVECIFTQAVVAEMIGDTGSFSMVEISILWDSICARLDRLCASHVEMISTPDEIIQIKEELLLLVDTISDEGFALKPHQLFETMKMLWERFEALQLETISNSSAQALAGSYYQPVYIDNEESFVRQIKSFKLDTIQFDEFEDCGEESQNLKSRVSSEEGSHVFRQGIAAANLDALEEDLNNSLSNHFASELVNATSAVIDDDSSGGASDNEYGENEQDDFLGDLNNGTNLANSSTLRAFIPKSYPFSVAVPIIMKDLHLLVVRFFLFAYRNAHLGSCGENVCRAVFNAFDVIGSRLIQEAVGDGADTPLSKACQISIDAATFAMASDSLWSMIEGALNHFRWGESIESHLPEAISGSKLYLNRVAAQAQDFVFELLTYKVDDLLTSLAMNNFEPLQKPTSPHEIIEEIVEFLEVTFMGLTHLPQSAREAAHFTCCTRVADGILKHLISPKVARVNVYTFVVLDLDVKRLLQFADSSRVPHLRHCFAEIMEINRVLLGHELSTLVDAPADRKKRFPKLDISKLIIILDKIIPVNVLDASLPKYDKTAKILAKKLRTQLK